jgi:hypothetical protein
VSNSCCAGTDIATHENYANVCSRYNFPFFRIDKN